VKAHQAPCSAAISHLPLKTYRDVSVTRPATNLPRHALRTRNYGFSVHVVWLIRYSRVPAMDDAEQPSPELYRLAQKLRELADQSHLPDIQGDLRQLAARFDRMAAYLEAQRRLGAARGTDKD
jgi:hypothetical protein